jgi:uncharacterized protein YqgC (DUF456 family)
MGLGLVLSGAFEAARALIGGQLGAFSLLNSVGLIIVSVAIIDLSKFVLEEYVLHSRQLRSLPEARQSLTKFMTIVIIAFALEALVTTFEVGRDKMFPHAALSGRRHGDRHHCIGRSRRLSMVDAHG